MSDAVFRLIFLLVGLALIGVAAAIATRGAIRLIVIGTLVLLSILAIRLAADQFSPNPTSSISPTGLPSPPRLPASPTSSPTTASPTPSPAESLVTGQPGMDNLPGFARPLTTAAESSDRSSSSRDGSGNERGQASTPPPAVRPAAKRPVSAGW